MSIDKIIHSFMHDYYKIEILKLVLTLLIKSYKFL